MFQLFARIAAAAITSAALAMSVASAAPQRPLKIVAFGDSLTTGFGLPAADAFPAQLTRALIAKGYKVEIADAGVSGETAADGLARLDWSVPEDTDAVILELGANDMLRGFDPKLTRTVLHQILTRLVARHVPVLLCGMRATPDFGENYARAFDPIFPELAAAFANQNVVFYPFFLDGVVANPKLNQADGLHPTTAGVAVIVERILPKVEELIARAASRPG